jgi:hypothetical protein
LNPGTIGANGAWYFGFGVALRLPIVRPWKDWWNETISYLSLFGDMDFPTLRANFRAASFASEPLLHIKVRVAVEKPPVAWVSWMSCLERRPVWGLW